MRDVYDGFFGRVSEEILAHCGEVALLARCCPLKFALCRGEAGLEQLTISEHEHLDWWRFARRVCLPSPGRVAADQTMTDLIKKISKKGIIQVGENGENGVQKQRWRGERKKIKAD